MKTGVVICGPDVPRSPLALLSGTFEEKAARAAALGFDGVELAVRDPTALDWSRMQDTLRHCALEVPQIVTGEVFNSDGLMLATPDATVHRRAVERALAIVDLAERLDAMVNLGRFRGGMGGQSEGAAAWGTAVHQLRPAMEYAHQHGVRVTIEPINRYETDLIHTVREGLRMVRDLGLPNVGLMLDLFHMNIEEASIEEGLREAGERLWHVHIADSNRRFPGAGHIPFAPIFAALRDMGYEGYVSAELLPWPDADTAAVKTITFLRQYR